MACGRCDAAETRHPHGAWASTRPGGPLVSARSMASRHPRPHRTSLHTDSPGPLFPTWATDRVRMPLPPAGLDGIRAATCPGRARLEDPAAARGPVREHRVATDGQGAGFGFAMARAVAACPVSRSPSPQARSAEAGTDGIGDRPPHDLPGSRWSRSAGAGWSLRTVSRLELAGRAHVASGEGQGPSAFGTRRDTNPGRHPAATPGPRGDAAAPSGSDRPVEGGHRTSGDV